MPRAKKDGRYINLYIDQKIYEQFRAYAEEKGQTLTTAFERIVSEYLNAQDDEKEKADTK
jgi:hypothetical protein